MLARLPPEAFTWSRWRQFDLFSVLSIPCRKPSLIHARDALREYAVGYCPGERLYVRPKLDVVGVMFFRGENQWCHLTREEFAEIFGVGDA